MVKRSMSRKRVVLYSGYGMGVKGDMEGHVAG